MSKSQKKDEPKDKPALVMTRPPKPYDEMTDQERDDYCGQVYEAIMGKKPTE